MFVCTSRQPVETVAAWLTLHGIAAVPDLGWAGAFWDRTDVVLVTNRKLGAVAYIDDRGIRFTSWPQALDDLDRYEAEEAAGKQAAQ